jgi:SAM-dependent methyltransferase
MSSHVGQPIRGQAIYTPFFLKYVYDPLVVHFANQFTWRCPSRALLDLYDEHVSADHLDVGPGTGWYLKHCRFPSSSPRLALMDINANVLARSASRLAKYGPEQFLANLLEPIDLGGRRFDSIGMTHVLHCLPGTMSDKARVFDHLRPLLRPGGVLFGSTILFGGVQQTRLSRSQLRQMNEQQVFCNVHDSLDALEAALARRFRHHTLCAVGSVGLFTAVP